MGRTGPDNVTRECTINLHKNVHGQTFRKRAPTAIKAIREFAQKAMGTKDVRLDPALNKEVWKRGIKRTNHRIRVRLARKRSEEEESKNKMYTLVQVVDVPPRGFKGMQTKSSD
eukprot:TRINITY_DN56071_c0_g1_i1.p2 TRINITY_DN56071_c0_g1~~TRINITY_DN56071_c0_g1_i1.p2  ORF type:complete len:114 (-),score=21.09 TRINITY_DN56071_c0_g1_i1:229-570(-)